jgi:hypothetical protein
MTALCVDADQANFLLVKRLRARHSDERGMLACDARHGLHLATRIQLEVVLFTSTRHTWMGCGP